MSRMISFVVLFCVLVSETMAQDTTLQQTANMAGQVVATAEQKLADKKVEAQNFLQAATAAESAASATKKSADDKQAELTNAENQKTAADTALQQARGALLGNRDDLLDAVDNTEAANIQAQAALGQERVAQRRTPDQARLQAAENLASTKLGEFQAAKDALQRHDDAVAKIPGLETDARLKGERVETLRGELQGLRTSQGELAAAATTARGLADTATQEVTTLTGALATLREAAVVPQAAATLVRQNASLQERVASLETALALKADASVVTNGLAMKANTSDVNTALAGKADKSDLEKKLDKSAFEEFRRAYDESKMAFNTRVTKLENLVYSEEYAIWLTAKLTVNDLKRQLSENTAEIEELDKEVDRLEQGAKAHKTYLGDKFVIQRITREVRGICGPVLVTEIRHVPATK